MVRNVVGVILFNWAQQTGAVIEDIINSTSFVLISFFISYVLVVRTLVLSHHATDGSNGSECLYFPVFVENTAHPIVKNHTLANAPVTAQAQRVWMNDIPFC